jgi:hypothetical protein
VVPVQCLFSNRKHCCPNELYGSGFHPPHLGYISPLYSGHESDWMQIGGWSKNSRSGSMEMIPNICITHAYVMLREENCFTSIDDCKSGSQLCLVLCCFVLPEGFHFPFLLHFCPSFSSYLSISCRFYTNQASWSYNASNLYSEVWGGSRFKSCSGNRGSFRTFSKGWHSSEGTQLHKVLINVRLSHLRLFLRIALE